MSLIAIKSYLAYRDHHGQAVREAPRVTDLQVRPALPASRLAKIRRGLTPKEWARMGGMAATIIGLNVLGWWINWQAALGEALPRQQDRPLRMLGTGVLAYTLGVRHAFDADHIAAIDNTTRKLINDGQRPLSVGFFFSLGHSSVVLALAVLLNFGIHGLDDQVKNSASTLQHTTNIIGTPRSRASSSTSLPP